MPIKERWIFEDILLKRWDIDVYGLHDIVQQGIPIYDKNRNRLYEVSGDSSEQPYMYKMDDIEKFENDNPHLFESGNHGLDAKEKRELGQLRREKEKWDTSLNAAVQIGIFCHEQNREVTRDKVWSKAYEIDDSLPETAIEKIWKSIPGNYKSKGGRPPKDK